MSKVTGYWVSNYIDKLNKACSALDEHRVPWTIDDLQPNSIRQYCKKYEDDSTKICWSCSDYLDKYLEDLTKYELSVNSTADTLAKILENQELLNDKLDKLIELISKK